MTAGYRYGAKGAIAGEDIPSDLKALASQRVDFTVPKSALHKPQWLRAAFMRLLR